MNNSILKTSTLREIRNSLGRYLAILLIVALGVGFFAGLKITKASMLSTANGYLKEHNMFDYNLISTLGYDEKSLETIRACEGVRDADGSISYDVIGVGPASGEDFNIKAISMPETVNTLNLVEGRFPEAPDECVVDASAFGRDSIGEYLEFSENNDSADTSKFAYSRYKIVGAVTSPIYLNYERGTGTVGDGAINAFMYIPREGFKDPDIYTGIYLKLDNDYEYFSSKASDAIDAAEDAVTEAAEAATADRYDTILDDLGDEFQIISIMAGLTLGDLAGLFGFHEGETYVLSSDTNVGYATFEENANIINSIAKVFPVFFFLVAAMVCMTTMTRMIDEQRTQIGVLKALGYSNRDVLGKYMFYSGSAAGIGALIGFFFGTKVFPIVIWKAYGMMYDFESHVNYVFNFLLLIVSVGAALLCSMGSTWLSCSQDFKVVPAELIRPKAPASGKRIFLENIPLIWNRLSFLYKVSVRNIFRYKKRFFMMVLGISGCTALLIAGFGIDTTVSDVAKYQYEEITLYDYQLNFSENMTDALQKNFAKYADGRYGDIMFMQNVSADIKVGGKTRQANLVVTDGADMDKYMDLHDGKTKLTYPGTGEAIVCRKLNKQLGVEAGDTITITRDHQDFEVKVSGICDNYVHDFIYINNETYENGMGEEPEYKTAYVNAASGVDKDQLRRDAAYCAKYPLVAAYSVNIDTIDRVEKMMKSLNSVIILVIFCAGLLAFIVLYNLTNINITERIREIATIKVLGFYPNETAAYVFRENVFLTAISAVVGIPLGTWLLNFVIDQIVIDSIFFVTRITLMGYVYSVVLTFVFAFIVNIAMKRRLENVSMTESLKSIE